MESDDYPEPDEIKPYVAIGPTPELSITVHKETFDKTFILFTIVFGSALIIFVGVLLYYTFKLSMLPPVPKSNTQTLTMSTNFGAASFASEDVINKLNVDANGSAFITREICLANKNTVWKDDHCECQTKYFGTKCDHEKFNNQYFAVGVPSNNVQMTAIENIISDGKSFNDQKGRNSCSYYCDQTVGCNGFIYKNPGMCTLLKDNVIVPSDEVIPYSHDYEATLYMKDSNNLKFVDRIFLASHVLWVPSRYWMINNTDKFAQIGLDMLYKINFAPEYINAYGNFLGIYSLYPFNYDDIHEILEFGTSDKFYIHSTSEGGLNLPKDWKYKTPIYVMYVKT